MNNNRESSDPGRNNRIQKSSNLPDELELAVKIAKTYLAELNIPFDCNLHFYNSQNEVVLSQGSNIPRERLNIGGAMGLYKPASESAYVKIAGLPEMISTIAHETAHHFLFSKSALGKVVKNLDIIYEVHKEGSDMKVNTIIGDVNDHNRMLFHISKVVQEGFATWTGHYVLRRFVDNIKSGVFDNGDIDMNYLKHLVDGYEYLSRDLDGRSPEYYYGRLEYRNIEGFFGPNCVPMAALVCMNVSYNNGDISGVVEANNALISQQPEVLKKNIKALKTSPNLRLIALSRFLPANISDDISKMDDPDYFLNAVRRFLGDDFLDVKIKSEDARIKHEEGAANKTGIAFGEILAEMVYGKGDMKSLVQEFSGIANKEFAYEIDFLFESFGQEVARKRAKEMLNNTKATDDNVKIGEAIGRLGYVREREEILDCLRVLKGVNSDAKRLYEMVSRGEFEGAWERYLRELKKRMSQR